MRPTLGVFNGGTQCGGGACDTANFRGIGSRFNYRDCHVGIKIGFLKGQGPRLFVKLNAMVEERLAKGRRPALEHLLQDNLLSRRKFANTE